MGLGLSPEVVPILPPGPKFIILHYAFALRGKITAGNRDVTCMGTSNTLEPSRLDLKSRDHLPIGAPIKTYPSSNLVHFLWQHYGRLLTRSGTSELRLTCFSFLDRIC